MNIIRPLFFATATSLLAILVVDAAPRSRNVPMRDAATHDELSQKLRMAQQSDPIRELGPEVGETDKDPSKESAPRDFIKSSTILSYRGFLTFVPKRAVLHVPEKLQSRLAIEEGAQVKTFQQFLQANRGWIRTVEVTRERALGHVAFPESTTEAIAESNSIVIATYKKGPISVLPLKEEEEVPTPSEMKPVTFQR